MKRHIQIRNFNTIAKAILELTNICKAYSFNLPHNIPAKSRKHLPKGSHVIFF